MLNILAASIPIRFPFFKINIGPKHKKLDHSPNSAPDDQGGKRAGTETMEADTSLEDGLDVMDWQMLSDCVGEWLWSCQNRVGIHSQWGLQVIGGEQDDSADWPTALHQRSYWYEKHLSLGAQGWGLRDKEDIGAVTEAVPCTFLLAVQEGHDLCHGQPAGTLFRWFAQAPQHFHQCGVVLPHGALN